MWLQEAVEPIDSTLDQPSTVRSQIPESDPIEEESSPSAVAQDTVSPHQAAVDFSKSSTDIEEPQARSVTSPVPALPVEPDQALSTEKSGYLASSEQETTQESKVASIPAAQQFSDNSSFVASQDPPLEVELEPQTIHISRASSSRRSINV